MASGLEERQLLIPANLVFDSGAAIEIDQVGAASEQHVLAIVDNFASSGVLIRRGASSEVRTALKYRHAKPGFSQCAPRGKAG
jgi:hypothetical protein